MKGSVRWDAAKMVAVSDAYNTIHFATPLIELSIDKITPAEAKEYAHFRKEYSELWRTYFDPIGLRLSLDAKRVRVETHILPLAGSEQYRTWRQMAGQGKFRFEPRTASIVDFQFGLGDNGKEGVAIGFQVDGDALLREMVELLIRWEVDPRIDLRREYDRLFWKLPLGVSVRGQAALGIDAKGVVELLKGGGLLKGEPKQSTHRNVTLHRLTISEEGYRQLAALSNNIPPSSPLAPVLAVLPMQVPPPFLLADIDGTLHISANEDFLKKRIDEAEARKKSGDKKAAKPAREVNAGLFIGPSNARQVASPFLEYEGHSLALLNNQVWNCFYQAGLLKPNAAEAARKESVRRFLGFIPVSPDGTAYRYDARLGEVVNERHGSLRLPRLHGQVAETSELGKFLEQIKALNAELRFLDNGLHTVLTIERK